jgi:hypothetical protein
MNQKKTVKHIFVFPQKTSFVFFVLLAVSLGLYVSADEKQNGKDYSLFRDADQDGLSDEEEKVFGTDPFVRDTDGDSYADGVEVESGYDPLKPAPGDKLISLDDNLGKGGYDDTSAGTETNVTTQASHEVADILSNVSDKNPSVRMQDINASVEELLQKSTRTLEKRLADAPLVIVRSQSIDGLGEMDGGRVGHGAQSVHRRFKGTAQKRGSPRGRIWVPA